MEMSNAEIVKKYIENGRTTRAVKLLSELNACTEEKIVDILVEEKQIQPKDKPEEIPEYVFVCIKERITEIGKIVNERLAEQDSLRNRIISIDKEIDDMKSERTDLVDFLNAHC